MRIRNFWFYCNVCQVRFPVPAAEYDALTPGGWPTHKTCGLDSVSEDDMRFVTLDKRIEARLGQP